MNQSVTPPRELWISSRMGNCPAFAKPDLVFSRVGTLACERQRCGATDAVRGPGHKRDLPRKLP